MRDMIKRKDSGQKYVECGYGDNTYPLKFVINLVGNNHNLLLSLVVFVDFSYLDKLIYRVFRVLSDKVDKSLALELFFYRIAVDD